MMDTSIRARSTWRYGLSVNEFGIFTVREFYDSGDGKFNTWTEPIEITGVSVDDILKQLDRISDDVNRTPITFVREAPDGSKVD
jgi:hypothetical protein